MGNLFSSDKKKEKKKEQQQQQQQKSQYQTKSQFPSQKKELTEGEKQRIRLQLQRDELRKKQQQIEIQIDTYDKEIKKLVQDNKRDQAKFVLQRKLLYDKFLENILQKQQIIETTILTVDQIQSDKEMADIVTQTNQVMKDIQQSIDQDKLQDAFMDMQEQKQRSEEMNQMYKQYQVDDENEIDQLYGKYEQQLFPTQQQKQQQFVPLQQQSQQQQQQKPKQQEKNEYSDKLAMLE